MKAVFAVLALSGIWLAAPLSAQNSSDHATHHPDQTAAAPMSEGEVRKIDKSAGKVTIKHGPLANLEMPAMTMVFRVKDPAMLDQIKEGDKIRFTADRVDGALTITELQVGK
jgi:Cu/Ag efflux protein CusF